MARQTITISKAGSNWTSAEAANAVIVSAVGSETNAWYDTAKTNNDLTAFSIALSDANTIVYTRTWSTDGWAALSARSDDADSKKAALESDGYTVTVVQPSYV